MNNKYIIGVIIFIITINCYSQHQNNEMKEVHQYTNQLVNETSPYLLQHAHNPVDWHPWNEKAIEKAIQEDKLLLISIGYSACHWCHVMEHESFEDPEIAKVMNDNFICIKVDREERPDIDQIYMSAVQLMNNRGGWPLNCIALPNGQPFWGGTYFQKENWKDQILQMANIYKTDRDKVIEFASKLSDGIQQIENISKNSDPETFRWKEIDDMVNAWTKQFDNTEGGTKGSPKFPMPNSYNFLLKYAHISNNTEIADHVELTLDKIAYGGIYDQIGGGFARYSTDKLWKVPHFEKMLYDNAQLVSLYSEAYLKYKKPLYRNIVFESLEFVERELMAENGAFYSALDADSEGEEGKFYVWEKEDLKSLISNDFAIFKDYYNINLTGFWEHKNYILIRKENKKNIAKKHKISINILEEKIQNWKNILMKERGNRIRPGLDDKSLTSWNALMLKGYIDAYMTFKNEHHLKIAIRNANFIIENQMDKTGKLLHSYKNGKSTINAYLEDYSLSISAFIRLYEATFDEQWLGYAETLTEYSINHFYDKSSGMFFFTSDLDPKLVARKMEVNDNVIPASNSVMANALFDLGTILNKENYKKISLQILNNVKPHIKSYGSGYANYASLFLKQISPYYQVAIVGKEAQKKTLEINEIYNPNKLFIGSSKESSLGLLENKYVQGSTMIYVCENNTCKLPTNKVMDALKQMK